MVFVKQFHISFLGNKCNTYTFFTDARQNIKKTIPPDYLGMKMAGEFSYHQDKLGVSYFV